MNEEQVEITVDLGGSPIAESRTVTIVLVGAPCRTKDAQEALTRMLKGERSKYRKADAKQQDKPPCGCKESVETAGQR